jgi:membrane-bound serine protease (ClpP class)
MRKYFILFIFIVLSQFCSAAPLILTFSEDLSLQKLQGINNQLDNFEGEELLLRLDSRTGELDSSLILAKRLFDLRVSKGVKITVYIENEALGPSALFPLLADRLLGTPSLNWGNILHETKASMPFDQLLSRVLGLIADNVPNSYLLRLVAQAMIDPNVDVDDLNGWKLIPAHPPNEEPAVFTRSDLTSMGFEIESLLPEQFNLYYAGSAAAPLVSSAAAVDERLKQRISYQKDRENLVGQLFIGPYRPKIDETTYLQVKFALEEYRKRGVIFIMMRLATPGGSVLSAMKIAELLQQFDRETHIPVVAVIYNWALSEGAMLAYASRFIAVTQNGLMGSAGPVIAGQESSKTKISALRGEMASLAQFYGRNPLIAEGMVDPDMILVIRDGNIVQLQNNSEILSHGDHPDIAITTKGKLLTLDSDQLLKLGVADILIPIIAAPVITPLELEMGEWPAKQSQLFNYPFFANIPFAEVIYYHNWKITFFAFLTHPIVASLLMIGFLICVYLELSQPGVGLSAALALVCLGLILLPGFVIGTIGWLEILCIAMGIGLIFIELLLLPGFAMLTVAGVGFILFGIIALFLPHLDAVHFSWNWNEWNLATIEWMKCLAFYISALLIGLSLVAVLARFVKPRLLKKSPIVLQTEKEPEPASLPAIDSEGEAFTSLRPGGKVLIRFHLYDALTEEGLIEKGEKVIVSKIRGNVIIVSKKTN